MSNGRLPRFVAALLVALGASVPVHTAVDAPLPEDLADRWPDLPEPTFFPDPEVRRREPDDPEFDAAPPMPEDTDDPPVPLSDTG